MVIKLTVVDISNNVEQSKMYFLQNPNQHNLHQIYKQTWVIFNTVYAREF